MDQPYLQADPPTSLPTPMTMGFETLAQIISGSISQSLVLPGPTLRTVSVAVMLDLAENGWEFHHDNWPGFTHSADDEECDG